MKLFLLLTSLTKEELKILRKAVLSPLYNSNKKVVQLFEVLRPKHPKFDVSQKAKQKFYKKLFPTEGFNDYKWRRVCMELTKVVEQVMIHIDTVEDDFARQKQLKQIYNKRGLYPFFKKHTTVLLTQLENRAIKSVDFYREKMDLLTEQYFHHTHDKYDLEDETLEQAMEKLDIYFVLLKMKLAIALKGKQQFLNKGNPILFIGAITKEWQNGFQADNILLNLYLQAIDFSEITSLETFKRYEQNLFTNIEYFEESDQKTLFKSGLNFIIKQNNRQNRQFNSFPFRWYRLGVENGVLFENNKLTEQTCINIIIYGCREKEYEWVENFIAKKSTNVHSKNPEASTLYFYGLLYFYKEDWDKSLDYLMMSEQKTNSLLQTRSIIIRVLFEKFLLDYSYIEVLLANLQSFEVYLRRDKLFAGEKLKRYFTYILIMRALARKIYANESKRSIQKWLDKKLTSSGPFPARAWIIQRIDKL